MAKQRVSRSLGGNVAMTSFLLLCGVFMVLPIVYTCISAFKPMTELFLYPPRFFVKNPTLDNFSAMFRLVANTRVPFERYLFNSVLVTVVGTAAGIILGSLAAYPMAKHKFRGRILLYNFVVWVMLFRPEVSSVPQYIVISQLNLIDTYTAQILPALSGSMSVFLMRQFMISSVPDSLLEAARIDGAGEMRTFWTIVMPMTKPAWLTLTLFTFQTLWNATGTQYIFTETMKSLPTALKQISAAGLARAGAASAISLVLMIPPIVLFLVTQSSVMETMSTSGIK